MHRLLLIFILSYFGLSVSAQNNVVQLTLQDVIDLSTRQSIDAFRQKNMYRASYWAYKYYRADKLPYLSIGSNPFSYNNSIRQDYVPQDQSWDYTQQRNITSSASLKLTQNLGLTGGNFVVSSDLGMSKNFLGDKQTLFSANQLSIGYSQRVNGFNAMNWKSKIEPLKFEEAKKNLIQSMENISLKATGKFFEMIDAQIEVNIANTNLANADTLYQIGKGRYQVGTVTQDELLNIELSLMNAKLAVIKANQGLVRARSDLNSYLALEKGTEIQCVLPFKVSNLKIDIEEALGKALKNNPDVLSQQEQLLEQDQNVAQTKANNGLSVNINAAMGLNQKATNFGQAYENPNQFQNLAIASLTVPILDWGKRKGAVLMAESNREVIRNSINQQRIDFQQSVQMSVMEFNLQSDQVLNSAKADTIAKMGFDVTMQRFKIGKVDITRLNLARNDVDNARRAYISSLQTYWTNYFTIRQLTLFDFEKGNDLSVDFDKVINQ